MNGILRILSTLVHGVIFESISAHTSDIIIPQEFKYFLGHSFFFLIGGYLLYNIVVDFAIHRHESATGVLMSPIPNPLPPPSHPIPLGCPNALALSALFNASNLDWSSVSHMIIYMFQCYSLKSSHPCFLPQSPKVCSLYLCLFCCLAYRVIITIFLNSIYMP